MGLDISEQELKPKKEFSVSFLLTARKQIMEDKLWNYGIRRQIWHREQDFKILTRFYISYLNRASFPKKMHTRAMPTVSKKWLFNSAFNIAVENTNQVNYFTEKLLDCFVALTVPIYVGCPNILEYFDARGMFIVHSVDEIISVVNSLTPSTYQKMLPYLKENKKRALKLLHLKQDIITEFGKKIFGHNSTT